jgi:NAD(P)-dependent dehydrogenase (short-subunit alcohol dehydrogenase family)
MDLQLGGRSVLVTGGSKGIGLAIAKGFASEGCRLSLVARSVDRLEQAAAAIRAAHAVEVRTSALDLGDAASRDRFIAGCGDIDILVNNAGSIPAGTIEDIDDAAWRVAWDLKVFGYVAMTRAFFSRMKARGRGVIINVIGTTGERLDAGYIAGSSANASLMALTRALGSTSVDAGVRVVGVNPGPVDSDRLESLVKRRAKARFGDENRWREIFKNMPFGRPATPGEIAATVVFLGSDLSSYTSGAIFTVDGGLAARSATP